MLHSDIVTADYEAGKDGLTFSVSKSDEKRNLAGDERPKETPRDSMPAKCSKPRC